MRAVLFLLAAFDLYGQNGPLSPAARFDLNRGLTHRVPRYARVFFAATPKGLTLVTVADYTSIVSADRNRRILHTTPYVTSVLGQIYRALPLPDGGV